MMAAVFIISGCTSIIKPATENLEVERKVEREKDYVQEDVVIVDDEEVEDEKPFWGIWCFSSKSRANAEDVAEKLMDKGFECKVVKTSDWTNLNSDTYYSVSAGVYKYEEDAKAQLSAVVNEGYQDAYVKYTGELR